jgi:hypothetical protein
LIKIAQRACDTAPGNDRNEQEVFRPRIFLRQGNIVREVERADTARLPPGTETVMLVDWREKVQLSKKLNLLWWCGNDWDKSPPAWSMPGCEEWLRRLNWWFRNPFHNFGRYVLGVGDQNYIVRITRRDDQFPNGDLKGWEIGEISLSKGRTLPWYSYGSEKFVFYWGWQPTGFGGLKLNRWSILLAPIAPLLFAGLVLRRLIGSSVRQFLTVHDLTYRLIKSAKKRFL